MQVSFGQVQSEDYCLSRDCCYWPSMKEDELDLGLSSESVAVELPTFQYSVELLVH